MNIDFDVANTSFDIPNPSLGTNYYFLYDTNNNNTLSDDTPILMTNTSGNTWRVSGINIDHNREFTIASLASSNNIPTDITLSPTNTTENIAA